MTKFIWAILNGQFELSLVKESVLMGAQYLDYDRMTLLDAENLAEEGIADAYNRLLPELRKYIDHPANLEEVTDPDVPTYAIRCNGKEHLICSADEPGTEEASWGRATYFFFLIVNEQLEGAGVRFYAINGGNELGGLFLTPEQARSAQAMLHQKDDWPYIPVLDPPWFGQFH
jgi:hypothetical protein